MTFFTDLTPCTYFAGHLAPSPQLLAVGWLDTVHPFPRGAVAHHTLLRLARLVAPDMEPDAAADPLPPGVVRVPWQPVLACGYHECEICSHDTTNWPPALHPRHSDRVLIEGRTLRVGANNLFVPGDGVVYLAPDLILHYILAHDYLPPRPFLMAVRRCPGSHSAAYRDLIVANGPSYLRDPSYWQGYPPRDPTPMPTPGTSQVWRMLRGWLSRS